MDFYRSYILRNRPYWLYQSASWKNYCLLQALDNVSSIKSFLNTLPIQDAIGDYYGYMHIMQDKDNQS
jgi:hypothetical protein